MADWWNRLRARGANKRGDVIVANVGAGARDVVVGKNILKIGTLVVPATPVLIGVIAFVIAVALGAYLYFVPDKMPRDFFNVAVAAIGESGADGRAIVTPNSQSFSHLLFTNLRDELAQLGASSQIKPVVWHDSMFPAQIRAQIGLIPGDTPQARYQAAETRAGELGAKMIVYGNLQRDVSPPLFTPEFFVATLTNEADEIAGRYQFGAPIPVFLSSEPGSTWASSLAKDRTYTVRRQALARVTFGLSYDLGGDHEEALKQFQDALAEMQKSTDRTGEDVIFYFVGREYLILANKKQADAEAFEAQASQATADAQAKSLRAQAQDASAQVEPLLKQAEGQFQRALERNADYARAHAGSASVARLRALRQSPQQRLDQPDLLNRAFAEYQIALNRATMEGEDVTQSKMQIYLGSTFFLQGEAFLFRFDWQKAIDAFDESIKRTNGEVGKLEPKQVWRSLAEAYLTLGNAYLDKGIAQDQLGNQVASRVAFDAARANYAKCIELKDRDRTLVQGAVARCERYQAIVRERAK